MSYYHLWALKETLELKALSSHSQAIFCVSKRFFKIEHFTHMKPNGARQGWKTHKYDLRSIRRLEYKSSQVSIGSRRILLRILIAFMKFCIPYCLCKRKVYILRKNNFSAACFSSIHDFWELLLRVSCIYKRFQPSSGSVI